MPSPREFNTREDWWLHIKVYRDKILEEIRTVTYDPVYEKKLDDSIASHSHRDIIDLAHTILKMGAGDTKLQTGIGRPIKHLELIYAFGVCFWC